MSVFKTVWNTLFKRNSQDKGIKIDQKSVEEMFNELYEVRTKKQRVSEYLIDLEVREEEVKRFEALSKEEVHKLNALASQAKAIEEKKQNLKGRLIQNNAALARISKYEEELPEMIEEMQVAEKRKRETENNMFYLQEEREELLEERESLLKGYGFLKGFSLILILCIGMGLLVAFAMLQVLREEIWVYLSAIGCLLIVFLVGIIYAKDRMDTELQKNGLLQQKAVRYLNKSKIRYFHQTRYLEFQYHKLGVDSVAKLELYYSRYLKNKDNEKIYLQFNQTLEEIERQMLEIIEAHHIEISYIENLSDWILSPQKANAIKSLKEDRQKTTEQLQALNTYEQELWKEVFVMQEDPMLKSIIQGEISRYNDSGRLDKKEQGA